MSVSQNQTASPQTATSASARRRRDIKRSRSIAKIGMTVSLGGLVATGMMKGPNARKAHLIAGVSMVGFSMWHYTLYQPKTV